MARAKLGASARSTARRAGVSLDAVRRVELGDPHVQVDTLAAVAEAVGLDLVLRAYPATRRLRDAGQLRIIDRIRASTNAGWHVELEVPAGDHGEAIDIGLFGPAEILAIEVDRVVLDVEERHRRYARKREHLAARHQRPVRLVIAANDTRRNRDAVNPHIDLIRSVLPAGSREILASIRTGTPLGKDGLLWIRPLRVLSGPRSLP